MFLIRRGLESTRTIARNYIPVQVVPRATSTGHAIVAELIKKLPERPVTRDRTEQIPVEVSINYMKSAAYKQTYGDDPIWKTYQRNYKGHFPPRKTRKTCIRNRMITTSSPCPVCRDEYLVIDYRNTELLKQFISEHTGEILNPSLTNVCERKHKHICISILKAKDYGTIPFDLPVRSYDYQEWYDKNNQVKKKDSD